MSEARTDLLLGERVRAAADRMAGTAVPAFDARALVARGLRQRRMHRASLGAALLAVATLVAVIGLRSAPTAERVPSFIVDPPASEQAAPGAGTTGPTPSAEPTGVGPPSPGPSDTGFQPQLRSEVAGCVPVRAVAPPEGIEVRLTLDDTIYARDAQIQMTLTVRNTAERSVEYQKIGQRYDFWIQRNDGVVWTWAYGRAFPSSRGETSIGPGGTERASASWDRSLCAAEPGGAIVPGTQGSGPPPGRYVARALWRTYAGGWWSNPVDFVVL